METFEMPTWQACYNDAICEFFDDMENAGETLQDYTRYTENEVGEIIAVETFDSSE